MKLFITGCHGMLGSALAKAAREEYDVYGIDITPSSPADIQYTVCDITDGTLLNNIIESIQPDIIVHCAAWTDVDACEHDEEKADLINARATEAIAQQAQQHNALLCM